MVRAGLQHLAGNDADPLLAFCRKVCKELTCDEREKTIVRRKLKAVQPAEQCGMCPAQAARATPPPPASSRPRLGVVSFLHRFGSALNHHVHLHACVTDGVFVPPADEPSIPDL